MDPDALVARLQRSREQLRAVLLAGQPGHEDADVFPRSRTMRFLLDPARRGLTTAALGSFASFAFGRRRGRRGRQERPGLVRRILGLFLGRR